MLEDRNPLEKLHSPAAKPVIRILLVDDELVVRNSLKLQFQLEPGVYIVGEARNGREAIQMTAELNPDLVIMDLLMPDLDGLLATARLAASYPQLKIIILSVQDDLQTQALAIAAGATDFVAKRDVETLLEAVRRLIYQNRV
ncbi:MAG: response regulator transcription factor [Chloroflexota bacterium]|nr:response regulator transcription factor [Chloroflexota bacterium]